MARAASARLALRVRIWIGVSTGLRATSPRGNGVGGTLSTPTMRTISSTMSALPSTSGRQDGTATFILSGAPAAKKPRCSRMRRASGCVIFRPDSRGTSPSGKSITFSGTGRVAGDHDLGRRAAAQVEHHLGRELEARAS